jgi:hypothetical protein
MIKIYNGTVMKLRINLIAKEFEVIFFGTHTFDSSITTKHTAWRYFTQIPTVLIMGKDSTSSK